MLLLFVLQILALLILFFAVDVRSNGQNATVFHLARRLRHRPVERVPT